ncbi:hypothetical protein ZWY2020_009864 [Hordeum vulgare]|nr:hypothetical protein ZWY2020_009864 [Hordeum vulgare]
MVRGLARLSLEPEGWPVLVPQPAFEAPPKAARLRCVLCAATFSASNTSRSGTEQLKREACLKFATAQGAPLPPPSQNQHQQLQLITVSPHLLDRAHLVHPPLIIVIFAARHSTDDGGRKHHALAATYAPVEAASHHHHVMVIDPVGYSPTPPTARGIPVPRHVLSGGRATSPCSPCWRTASSTSSRPRRRRTRCFGLAADGLCEQVITISINLLNDTSVFHRVVPMPMSVSASPDYA